MSTAAAVFDEKLARWKQEMNFPWARLKYKLTQANLARHLGTNHPLRILDAGGGNGLDSLPFAAQGHFVEIVDYSQEMLADALVQAREAKAQKNVHVHQSDLRYLPQIFPEAQFDLVLCHNVLQYLEDIPTLLRNLVKVLKPGGLISIISVNRYSNPYQSAFFGDNLVEALVQLETRTATAKIFEASVTSYCAAEISAGLEEQGLIIENDYGLRCLCDYWGDNQRKLDPAIFEQLEKLEFTLTDRHPYKLLARYFQVIARKTENG